MSLESLNLFGQVKNYLRGNALNSIVNWTVWYKVPLAWLSLNANAPFIKQIFLTYLAFTSI